MRKQIAVLEKKSKALRKRASAACLASSRTRSSLGYGHRLDCLLEDTMGAISFAAELMDVASKTGNRRITAAAGALHLRASRFAALVAKSRPKGDEPATRTKLSDSRDELFLEAVRLVIEEGRGSVALLQTRLQIGYARAAEMIEKMETKGIVGPHAGFNHRKVRMTLKEWENRNCK